MADGKPMGGNMWSLNHAQIIDLANACALCLSDNRFSQIAGGIPPAAKYGCMRDILYRRCINQVHLNNGRRSWKKVSDRSDQVMQLLLFTIYCFDL